MLVDLSSAILASISVFFGLCFLRIGILVLRGDRNEYDRNRNRVRSIGQILHGDIPTKYDGTRDDKVAAGIAIDLRTNEWREQGRLSDEALRDALAR